MRGLSLSLGMSLGGGGPGANPFEDFHLVTQNARLPVLAKNGGSNRGTRNRNRHVLPVPITEVYAVIPLFEIVGTPLIDTLFANQLFWQIGLEYPYSEDIASCAPRTPFTFGGLNYASYNPSVWDIARGYIISDKLTVDIPAGEYFGLWTTEELPAGSWANQLPCSVMATNFLGERGIGQSFSASSSIAALGGASDFALTATTITELAQTQTGVTGIFTPLLFVKMDPGVETAAVLGDSLGQASTEGGAGSGSNGDTMGSANGNCTMYDRACYDIWDMPLLNLSKGSDGNKFWATPSNWKYRRQLLALSKPTYFINGGFHNDCSANITITGWAQSTAVTKYLPRSANSAIWMAENDGTTLSSGTGPSGAGPTFQDNNVLWHRIMNFPAPANARGAGQMFAWMASTNDQVKEILPDVQIVHLLGTPDSSSNDNWTANQTVATGWGDATSRRGLMNAMLRALNARLQIDYVLDPNPSIELSYPTETGLWAIDGVTPNVWNADNQHMNSEGHLASASDFVQPGV